jgi:hypothetical protein
MVADPQDAKPLPTNELPVGDLRPGKYQPRRAFRPDQLQELAESIAKNGIMQPIIVRVSGKVEGKYEIVAGERRWRASQEAGLEQVPVIIRDIPDKQALELALVGRAQASGRMKSARAVAVNVVERVAEGLEENECGQLAQGSLVPRALEPIDEVAARAKLHHDGHRAAAVVVPMQEDVLELYDVGMVKLLQERRLFERRVRGVDRVAPDPLEHILLALARRQHGLAEPALRERMFVDVVPTA